MGTVSLPFLLLLILSSAQTLIMNHPFLFQYSNLQLLSVDVEKMYYSCGNDLVGIKILDS